MTQGETILIVDDEENILSTLSRALRLEGFETRTARGARSALEQLDGVDLVLTDVSMPEMDGLALLSELRRRKPLLPVAIMTAHASVEDGLRAMQEGAYDYLLKPCHTEEILLKVRLGLRMARYEHELRERNKELEEARRDLERANRELAEKNVELERLATTDPLTQLANRRRFMAKLDEEAAKSRRYGRELSLIFADIDHFKRINDTAGHPAGDRVLVEVGKILFLRARETDLPARIGGEEFAVLLPETRVDGAMRLAEELRATVAGHNFPGVGRVTMSFGVAMASPATSLDPEALLKQADDALYRAKRGGRNRVEPGEP